MASTYNIQSTLTCLYLVKVKMLISNNYYNYKMHMIHFWGVF